jgi:hypothetical protein
METSATVPLSEYLRTSYRGTAPFEQIVWDDRMIEMQERVDDYLGMGVEIYAWEQPHLFWVVRL